MIHLENRILIDKPVDEVFKIVTDVARWPEFLPSHRNMTIISQEEDRLLIEWKMKVKLKTSILIDRINKRMVTEQLSGLVKGLKAEYKFSDQSGKTSLSLIHQVELKIPLIRRIIELIAIRSLMRLSPDTLNRIKNRVEEIRCSMD
ncbi:MAG: SRPBCC family protein [bacterium]